MPIEATAKQPSKRSDTGPRITQRDLAALSWIAQQCAIRLDHLCILLARLTEAGQYAKTPKEAGRLTEKRTTSVVRRWEALGLIEKQWMLNGSPPWLWLTPEGLRLVSEEIGGYLRSAAPTLSSINHLHHCNHVRLMIEQRLGVKWISDRQLRAGMKIKNGKRQHRPDATITTGGKKLAIEVELSKKSRERLAQILKELAGEPEYIAIWYFTKGRRSIAIKQAIAELPQEQQAKFVVYNLDDIKLTGEQDEVIAQKD